VFEGTDAGTLLVFYLYGSYYSIYFILIDNLLYN